MHHVSKDGFVTPRRDDLPLTVIRNAAGLTLSLLPSGALFAQEHVEGSRRILINQTLASPLADGMAGLFLRIAGASGPAASIIGAQAGL